MTISPLMELFAQLIRWTCSKLTSRTFLLRGRLGRFPPGHECVESIISQRGETWKSKALLIYHFKYILFVSSWKKNSHCFLNFIGCCLRFAYSMMQLFWRKVGWWSCVMVTVLLKKTNRQRCLLLKHFPGSDLSKTSGFFFFFSKKSLLSVYK